MALTGLTAVLTGCVTISTNEWSRSTVAVYPQSAAARARIWSGPRRSSGRQPLPVGGLGQFNLPRCQFLVEPQDVRRTSILRQLHPFESVRRCIGFHEQSQNPFHLAGERALSRQHQQRCLVFNALWEPPIGGEEAGNPAQDRWIARVFGHIRAAPIFTVKSGRPVHPLTGIDSNRSSAFPLTFSASGAIP